MNGNDVIGGVERGGVRREEERIGRVSRRKSRWAGESGGGRDKWRDERRGSLNIINWPQQKGPS
jgi:hypothetical protein